MVGFFYHRLLLLALVYLVIPVYTVKSVKYINVINKNLLIGVLKNISINLRVTLNFSGSLLFSLWEKSNR